MATVIFDCPSCFSTSPPPPGSPPPPPAQLALAPCCTNLFAPNTLYAQMILESTAQGNCSCFANTYTLKRDDTCDSRKVWSYPLCGTTTICGIANSQFWFWCDPNGPTFLWTWKNFNNNVPAGGWPMTICSCDPLSVWFPRVSMVFYGADPAPGPVCSGIFSVCINTTGDFTNCFNCNCCMQTLGTYPATPPLHATISNPVGSCTCLAGTYQLLPAAQGAWLSNPLMLCGTTLVFGVSCNPVAVNGWLFSIYQLGNATPLVQAPMTLHGCEPFSLELTQVSVPGPVPCSGAFVVSVGL